MELRRHLRVVGEVVVVVEVNADTWLGCEELMRAPFASLAGLGSAQRILRNTFTGF